MKVGVFGESARDRALLEGADVPRPLIEAHLGALLARVLVVTAELRLMDHFQSGPLHTAEVARRAELDQTAVDKILRVLVAAGYLRRNGDVLALTETSRRWLLSESPGSVTEYLELLPHNEWAWAARCRDYVRTGKPVDCHRILDDRQWRLYQNGMRVLASREFDEFAEVAPVPDHAREMLDLGGSHGGYSVALCRRWPRLRSRIVDLPDAVRHAVPLLEREGMGERVSHVVADVREYDFQQHRPDLVLVSHLCHHLDEAENRSLLHRIAEALSAGGIVVVQDHIAPDEPGEADLVSSLLDLSFGVSSGSALWSAECVRSWQTMAGLRPLDPVPLRSNPGILLLAAQK